MSLLPVLQLRSVARFRATSFPILRWASTANALSPEDSQPTDHAIDLQFNPSQEVTVKQAESSSLSQEDLEIKELIRKIATATDLESPRLYASFDVGKPLVGELAPIRKREHKWVPPLGPRQSVSYEKTKNQRPSINFIAFHQRKRDFTPRGLQLWMKRLELKHLRKDQTYCTERVGILGPELAAAHFFVYRGGRVKFHGVDKWFSIKDGSHKTMPSRHLDNARVEAIDASGLPLLYEGMDHFIGLRSLKYLSLKNCPRIDDWCLPKLFILNKTLEYLDLSGCPKITERGIACLYHLSSLRNLLLADMPKVENKELVALLLEDELPLCEIEGVAYNQPPPVLIAPREQTMLEEEEWTKKGVPLLHRIAHPEYVEVGNKAYNLAYEEEHKKKSLF
ncbi:putative ATP synthase subunit s-like protein [Hypsibius exemplaris]|uniref:ATP synthase subunit s-like protein n=1 Tax=Hypsibius exemplaris TaxID=2072580 RepID=A0A1W0XCG5_HYPEX|nr:putative ATP synthase subunit s-like protein [Hypsibius exemplaris]